jgi:multidrug resistance protein MdtO
MTTAATALPTRKGSAPWLDFLRAELAPTAGRLNATIRIVTATAIVLATSMTLEVPTIAVSVFVVLFLTKLTAGVTTQNSVAVAATGIVAIVVATIAIAIAILMFRYTIGWPPLRLAAMAFFFFLGMYAQRVFALGAVGFLVAILIPYSQTLADLSPEPEPIVRGVLWIWMAVVYPAIVTIGVNLLLLPADPGPLLRREIAARLLAIAHAIACPRETEARRRAVTSLAAFAVQGTAPLLGLLRLAKIRDSSIGPLHAERAAKILLLGQLVESAALVVDVPVEPSRGEQERLATVATACERLAAAVSSGTETQVVLPPPLVQADTPESALSPMIGQLERFVLELIVAERPSGAEPVRRTQLFVADAFTNPAYVQFALKVTLAAMFCYVAYTALDWNGIHTSMLTCVIVGLGSAGATIHKATLRLAGCAIGGGLALAAIVFLVPHMTSILQLMLLVTAVTAPAAWIAMGSERTAYLGIQLAFTFCLAVLQGFEPSTDLTEFRDRFVGVVFGVIVMAIVFTYVWPELAGFGMRRSLAAALRRMSELALDRGGEPVRAAAWHAIEEATQLSELHSFESGTYAPDGREHRRIEHLLDLTRRILLVQSALDRLHEREARGQVEATTKTAHAARRQTLAAALSRIAGQVEAGHAASEAELRAPFSTFAMPRIAGGDVTLWEELADRIRALEQAASDG